MVSPDTTWRFGTVFNCSAWSGATLMIRSTPPDSTSATWVCRSGMKRISILSIFGCGFGLSLK